jgi:hypothetical protein
MLEHHRLIVNVIPKEKSAQEILSLFYLFALSGAGIPRSVLPRLLHRALSFIQQPAVAPRLAGYSLQLLSRLIPSMFQVDCLKLSEYKKIVLELLLEIGRCVREPTLPGDLGLVFIQEGASFIMETSDVESFRETLQQLAQDLLSEPSDQLSDSALGLLYTLGNPGSLKRRIHAFFANRRESYPLQWNGRHSIHSVESLQ